MMQHSSRSRRWWSMLTSLDKHISMSSSLLGGFLLEHAGLSQMERSIVTRAGSDADSRRPRSRCSVSTAMFTTGRSSSRGSPRAGGADHDRSTMHIWVPIRPKTPTSMAKRRTPFTTRGRTPYTPPTMRARMQMPHPKTPQKLGRKIGRVDEDELAEKLQAGAIAWLAWDRLSRGRGKPKSKSKIAKGKSFEGKNDKRPGHKGPGKGSKTARGLRSVGGSWRI